MERSELINKISKSTEKQAEKMLMKVCKDVGLKSNIKLHLPTCGFSWTIDHMASAIYLKQGEIDKNSRMTLKLLYLALSYNSSYRDLYRANTYLKEKKKSDWDYNRELEKIESMRKDFREKALRLVCGKLRKGEDERV